MSTVSAVFSNSFERVERRKKDVGWVFPFHQSDSYILQLVEDIVEEVQTVSKFPVHVVVWVKGRHENVESEAMMTFVF
jgi:hypothetical protein